MGMKREEVGPTAKIPSTREVVRIIGETVVFLFVMAAVYLFTYIAGSLISGR